MKIKHGVLCLFVLIFLQGCIPSLHPLYTQKDVVLHKALKDKSYQEGNSQWHFREISGKKNYQLNYIENEIAAQFEVHLVKLGDHLFFDFFPTKEKAAANQQSLLSSGNSFYEMHQMPVHTFAKVEFTNDGIIIKQFDADWIDKLFRERRIRIKHEITDHGNVLTASTKELQKFVLKYAEEEQAYLDPILLKPKA